MPSPFPGMDPYLESPWVFPDLHHSFIIYLKGAIQSALPAPYYAKTEDRVWIERPQRSVVPDVSVSRPETFVRSNGGTGALGLLDEPAMDTETVELGVGHEVRELSLHVFVGNPGDPGRLVTAIELLSPSNKSAGSAGRAAYVRKQVEVLERDVHLLEIDLLRGGQHTTAIPRELLRRPFDYHISARDLNSPPTEMYSYPVRLEDPLPRFAVPLLAGEGYVTIELQQVFDRCYDEGAYRREINYVRDEPDPPLSDTRRSWARERIECWLDSAEPHP